MTFSRCLFLALALTLSLGGCAPSDTVRLLYHSASPAVLPAPDAPRVTVVLFEDARPNKAIGERKNHTPFQAASSVSDWVSRSLADELTRHGPQVSYAVNLPQAQAARPAYTVTGVVEQIWLKEVNATTFNAQVRLRITVTGPKGVVYAENLAATQEKSTLPSSSLAEAVLTETLREVLGVAAAKISLAVR